MLSETENGVRATVKLYGYDFKAQIREITGKYRCCRNIEKEDFFIERCRYRQGFNFDSSRAISSHLVQVFCTVVVNLR